MSSSPSSISSFERSLSSLKTWDYRVTFSLFYWMSHIFRRKSGGENNKKRPFTVDPALRRIIPLMKGKKHVSKNIFTAVCVCECEPWMCHAKAFERGQTSGVRRCSVFPPPLLPLSSLPMMDDGEWEVSSPGLQRAGHLLSIAGADGGLWQHDGWNREPGVEAGWAAEEWNLWNWQMKHTKYCLFQLNCRRD